MKTKAMSVVVTATCATTPLSSKHNKKSKTKKTLAERDPVHQAKAAILKLALGSPRTAISRFWKLLCTQSGKNLRFDTRCPQRLVVHETGWAENIYVTLEFTSHNATHFGAWKKQLLSGPVVEGSPSHDRFGPPLHPAIYTFARRSVQHTLKRVPRTAAVEVKTITNLLIAVRGVNVRRYWTWRRLRNTHVVLRVRANGDSPAPLAMTHMRVGTGPKGA